MASNRLLIIDDDPAIGVFISKVAKSCDYATVATTRADVFKERIENWSPTHIVLDLQMPGIDGIEMLRYLVGRQSKANVLLVSGFEPRVLEAARRFGGESGLTMSGTLTKPIRADHLRGVLSDLKSKDDGIDEASLSRAIREHELFLVYQPKVKLDGLKLFGYEALVRWQHPTLGLLPPGEFIPLAEASGIVDQLTEEVIEIGLRQLATWGADFDGTLAVNISGCNLRDLSLVDRIAELCTRHEIKPERLVLELTETNAMTDVLRAMGILTRLRLKGFQLSIDDFGTGYSSLLQLARLPFSEIKIDQSFVLEMQRSAEAHAIVKSTIDLAHNLGLRAVAEGVETTDVLHTLMELGCDAAQGYCIAKPLTVTQIDPWLAEWEGRRAVLAPDLTPIRSVRIDEPSHSVDYDLKAGLAQSLAGLVNPLWELGRKSLIGWRPAEGGIDVLMVPYQNIVDRFAESQRLLHGRRMMGEGTFRIAQEIAGIQPVHIPLRFKISDEDASAVPTSLVEHVLRRYGITETLHRAVALFDIVGFAKCAPRHQVAQLNSLECSISSAQGIMHELGRPIDLARTTTGDGFYVWNREKGAQADFDIYLLTMFVLAGNAISQQEGRAEMVPELRTCFSVGPHYSYHQVDGLDPRGHDYIVGDVTILLARMAAKCLPGQILLGDFRRPNDAHQGDEPEPTSPLEFVLEAGEIFAKHGKVKLHGRTVTGIRCYLTGEPRHADQFDVTRFRIRDKHGFDHDVFNQKFNVYLSNVSASADTLYLGRQKSDLTEFDALEMETMPLVDVSLPLDRLCA